MFSEYLYVCLVNIYIFSRVLQFTVQIGSHDIALSLLVAGAEDDTVAGNFLVLPQVDDVPHLRKTILGAKLFICCLVDLAYCCTNATIYFFIFLIFLFEFSSAKNTLLRKIEFS